jgi:hypothetical protein
MKKKFVQVVMDTLLEFVRLSWNERDFLNNVTRKSKLKEFFSDVRAGFPRILWGKRDSKEVELDWKVCEGLKVDCG